MKKIIGSFFTLLALGMMTPMAQACSVCTGDPSSPLSKGAIAGVVVLLLVVLGVLAGVAGFFVFISKKSAALAATKEQEVSFSSAERV